MAASPRIAVVGAGLAGLVAAERLQRAGVQAVVLGGVEERPVLAGLEFEPDFALLPRSAPELAALAAELGESAALRRGAFEGLTVVRGGKRAWTSLSVRPGVGQALAQRRLRALLRWFGPSLDPRVPERGVRLDDRSVADFAKLYIGRRALAERFAPLFAAGFGLDAGETSRLLLMLLLDPTGRPALSTVRGMSAISTALLKRLEDVRTEARVTRVAGRRVELADGEALEVDATLVATAASEVPGLLPDLCPAESQFFRRTIDEPRHVVAVALSPPGIECPAVAVAERGLLSAVVEITPPGTDAQRLLLLGRPGNADALDDEIADRFVSAALPLVGDLRPSLKEFAVVRRRVTRFDVGHYRGVARVRQEQEQRFDTRRVLLCGDYLVAPHAEGAVTAGIRGAEDLLSRLSGGS